MPLLSAADVTRIGATITGALPDVARIVTEAVTTDDAGGEVRTATTGPDVPVLVVAWVGRSGGEAADQNGHVATVTHWKLTFPAGTVVWPTDRVVLPYQLRPDGQPRQFDIVALADPSSYEVSTMVIAVERLAE